MKKSNFLVLALTALVVGSATNNALASNAREAVMGRGDAGFLLNKGSFSYDSMYNVFYNPAYVNDYKNWAIIEKGAPNQAGSEQAQAGFVTSVMNYNVGAFMNNDSFLNNQNNTGSVYGARPIDLFIGADMGVKWGAGFHYTPTVNNSRLYVASVGASFNGIDPFVHYIISANDKSSTTFTQKQKGYMAGVRYKYGEWVPYAYYTQYANETAANTEFERTYMTAGVARTTKLGESARLVYSTGYFRQNTGRTGGSDGWRARVPVEVAIEGDALTWLTLRAGTAYNLVDVNGAAGSQGDNTTARIGASFHVSKVDVDFAFGRNNGATTDTTASAGNIDANAVGFDSGTFSRVSLSYKW